MVHRYGAAERERFSYWREADLPARCSTFRLKRRPALFQARHGGAQLRSLRIDAGKSSAYYWCAIAASSMPKKPRATASTCRGAATASSSNAAKRTVISRTIWGCRICACRSAPSMPTAARHRRRGAVRSARAARTWVNKTALRRLQANSTYVDLARRHMLHMVEDETMSEAATALLTENLCNLIALATATDIAPSRMQAECRSRRCSPSAGSICTTPS